MEIMPTIDVTPFLDAIDLALRAAYYTVAMIGAFAVGYMLGVLMVKVWNDLND